MKRSVPPLPPTGMASIAVAVPVPGSMQHATRRPCSILPSAFFQRGRRKNHLDHEHEQRARDRDRQPAVTATAVPRRGPAMRPRERPWLGGGATADRGERRARVKSECRGSGVVCYSGVSPSFRGALSLSETAFYYTRRGCGSAPGSRMCGVWCVWWSMDSDVGWTDGRWTVATGQKQKPHPAPTRTPPHPRTAHPALALSPLHFSTHDPRRPTLARVAPPWSKPEHAGSRTRHAREAAHLAAVSLAGWIIFQHLPSSIENLICLPSAHNPNVLISLCLSSTLTRSHRSFAITIASAAATGTMDDA